MKEKTKKPKRGAKLKILIDTENIRKVDFDHEGGTYTHGPIADLDVGAVVSAYGLAVLHTTSSPGCVWVFYNGQYHRV